MLQPELFNAGVEMIIMLSFLKDIELFGREGVGLVVDDWDNRIPHA